MAWRPLHPSCYSASDNSLHAEMQPGPVLTHFSEEAGNPFIQQIQPGLCSCTVSWEGPAVSGQTRMHRRDAPQDTHRQHASLWPALWEREGKMGRVYVCTPVYAHVQACVCMYKSVHVQYMYMCLCVRMYAYVYTCVCTCACDLCVCMYAYMCDQGHSH